MENNGRRIPCKCLLKEAGEEELSQSIAQYVSTLNEDIRADGELYKRRLEICRSCAELLNGTCLKCGCYVEMRAAAANNHCPSENKYW